MFEGGRGRNGERGVETLLFQELFVNVFVCVSHVGLTTLLQVCMIFDILRHIYRPYSLCNIFLSLSSNDDNFCDSALARSYELLVWAAAGNRVMGIFMLPKGVRKGKIGEASRERD